MKIAICDDHTDIIQTLHPIIEEFFKDKQADLIIQSYSCLHDLLESSIEFDLAFLDIELQDGNGLQAAAELRRRNANVIILIVTSYQHYLDDAMALNVFRYVSKPIDKERLIRNMKSAWEHYCTQTQTVYIGNHGGTVRVFTQDILYVCIKNRGTELITMQGGFESTQGLKFWADKLSNVQFAQPHYSYLVNLRHVVDLKRRELFLHKQGGELIKLPVSQRMYIPFKGALYTLMEVNAC